MFNPGRILDHRKDLKNPDAMVVPHTIYIRKSGGHSVLFLMIPR